MRQKHEETVADVGPLIPQSDSLYKWVEVMGIKFSVGHTVHIYDASDKFVLNKNEIFCLFDFKRQCLFIFCSI